MPTLYQIRADGSKLASWEVGDKPLVAGRGDFADVYVDDDALSRSHFLITREGDEFFLIDLDSSNGTWLEGELVSARRLHSGQIIAAGESLFYFSEAAIVSRIIPNLIIPLLESPPAAQRSLRPG